MSPVDESSRQHKGRTLAISGGPWAFSSHARQLPHWTGGSRPQKPGRNGGSQMALTLMNSVNAVVKP